MIKLNFELDGYPSNLEEKVKNTLGITQDRFTINCGLWEEKECEVITNYVDSYSSCEKHSEKIAEVTYTWKTWSGDECTRTEVFYKTPRILIAKNEGGCNSTGVCVDCIIKELG